jgi:hypothetical protein
VGINTVNTAVALGYMEVVELLGDGGCEARIKGGRTSYALLLSPGTLGEAEIIEHEMQTRDRLT